MKKTTGLLIILLLLLICFQSQGTGGKGGAGQNTVNYPPCSEVYNNKRDIALSSVKLKYDLTALTDSKYISDLSELANTHVQISFFEKKGYIDNLMWILNNYSSVEESRRASLSVSFGATDCSTPIKIEYKDPADVMSNILKNAPDITANLNKVSFEIKSIKTSMNGIQLVWTGDVDIKKGMYTNIVFDKEASYTPETKAVITTRTGSNLIALREKEGMSYLIANTLDDGLSNELVLGDKEEIIISPILMKKVYSGGEYSSFEWDQPELYKVL